MYINFLIQLTEKDKRILVALFIVLILLFVLIAYIAQGIKGLMKRYAKGIDGYMYSLCEAKLVTNPREFRNQVFKKETKVLYKNTRWILRVFILTTVAFLIYSFVARPSGEGEYVFSFVGDNIRTLFIDFEWPKGEFFGIKNFPVDWPYVSHWPSPSFTLPAIVSYVMLVVWTFTVFGLFGSTLKFIARMNRARSKSTQVFEKSLDDVNFLGE